jgi:hypothetical protein
MYQIYQELSIGVIGQRFPDKGSMKNLRSALLLVVCRFNLVLVAILAKNVDDDTWAIFYLFFGIQGE